MSLAGWRRLAYLVFFFWGLACAQTTQPLSIQTTGLPKAYVQQPFQARLDARGGTPPYKWEVTDGSLPEGIALQRDGELEGTPTQAGEFHFTATVTDSGQPPYQKAQQFSVSVVSPLMARWGKYPKVNGQRLEGSILVSNETDHDFDLTMIALAVNETGRATAIGYQHFPLQKNTEDMEIPFGENLAAGAYQLNVDVVSEYPAAHSIHRVRLVPKERFQIQQGP
ncbi:MAG TPA: putative Ig domain-containing protein [Terriglobales bacterium]|nr:putative Ig domain-containing protein [Terriglobales bacterium]